MANNFSKNIAEAIYLEAINTNGAAEDALVKKVVEFLSRKRLLSKAPEILAKLSEIINKKENRIVAYVTSGEKLDEPTNKKIAELLSRRYDAKEIEIEEKIDKRLIGGYKIEINDEVIDLTLRNRIQKLQEHLTNPQ